MALATSTASTAFISASFRYLIIIISLTFVLKTHAATIDDWRSRSIYQLITDRFARTDGSTTAPCDLAANQYCGGTWQGIISQLDYIQGMGFTAVSTVPESRSTPRAGAVYCTSRVIMLRLKISNSQIWISPIVKNINGSAAAGEGYHGFWSQDITQVNPYFGTPDDLKQLSQALHDRGMVFFHQFLC